MRHCGLDPQSSEQMQDWILDQAKYGEFLD
jgi:hypothetical protein